ncbi:hypothetical protein GGD64_008425 [Bradyrhizobium sp. CIR3A]|nr:hypothetical protein [Bradyrhizobium sp. CIR3A]
MITDILRKEGEAFAAGLGTSAIYRKRSANTLALGLD